MKKGLHRSVFLQCWESNPGACTCWTHSASKPHCCRRCILCGCYMPMQEMCVKILHFCCFIFMCVSAYMCHMCGYLIEARRRCLILEAGVIDSCELPVRTLKSEHRSSREAAKTLSIQVSLQLLFHFLINHITFLIQTFSYYNSSPNQHKTNEQTQELEC